MTTNDGVMDLWKVVATYTVTRFDYETSKPEGRKKRSCDDFNAVRTVSNENSVTWHITKSEAVRQAASHYEYMLPPYATTGSRRIKDVQIVRVRVAVLGEEVEV